MPLTVAYCALDRFGTVFSLVCLGAIALKTNLDLQKSALSFTNLFPLKGFAILEGVVTIVDNTRSGNINFFLRCGTE